MDAEDLQPEESPLQLSDAVLLDGLRQGSHEAFATLFLRHYSPVRDLLYRLLGDVDEAEDVAQEVFLKLYQRPLSSEREHNLRAWLYRVATNLGYNALRAGRRRQERDRRADREVRQTVAGPDALVLAKEERRAVRETLARLSSQQAALLVLRYEGLSYAEVAAVLQVSPRSIGTMLARAEAEFKRQYLAGQKGGTDEALS